MGCFWTTNPFEPPLPVPGLDPTYSFHCADCNSVACWELGGQWLPFSCDYFMGIPDWRKGLDIFDCPIDDGFGDEDEVGYCCLPSNDGKSCNATGPWDDMTWCMTSGGQWIPSSYGTLNEIQARCDRICRVGRGACCNDDGTCIDGLNEVSCGNDGGVYQGAFSDCSTTSCDGLQEEKSYYENIITLEVLVQSIKELDGSDERSNEVFENSSTPDTIEYEKAMSGTDCNEGHNNCCPCMDCLDDCMRVVECGRSCKNGHCDPPSTGPKVPNQSIPTQERKKDCGPYQINPDAFKKDTCDACNYGWIDNPECCAICDDPTFGQMLCSENCNCETGYSSAACGNHASEAACCAEKERQSLLLLNCYRLRWTRPAAGNCEGNGPNGCYTCEDLGRMHQGGYCGHNDPSDWNDTHWGRIKSCMEEKCGYSNSGTSTNPNENCTPNPGDCDFTAFGACCNGEDCVEMTRDACAEWKPPSGPIELNIKPLYQGDGTSCVNGRCPHIIVPDDKGMCCYKTPPTPTPDGTPSPNPIVCNNFTESVCGGMLDSQWWGPGYNCQTHMCLEELPTDISCNCGDNGACQECMDAGCQHHHGYHCCCSNGVCSNCIGYEKQTDGPIDVDGSNRPLKKSNNPFNPNARSGARSERSNRPLKKSNIERQKFWEKYENDK